jgi:CheY-like chemotaxis protein
MSDQKHKILVVEDEKPLLNVIEKKIQTRNIDAKAEKARSADEAEKKIKNNDIDAIWLDHYLLGEDSGLEFLIGLKEDDSLGKDIPIFVVSNTASKNKVKSYLRFGIDEYYTKADNKLGDIVEDLVNYIEQ